MIFEEGITELDKDGQLCDIHRTRIMISRLVLNNDNKDTVILKAILEVVDITKAWKKDKMIMSAVNKEGRIVSEKNVISE